MEINIKTKFDIGAHIYLMYQNKVADGKIVNIKITTEITDSGIKHNYNYQVNGSMFGFNYFTSKELFATKQDLLNSL